MAGVDISVLGAPELSRKLKKLENSVQKKIVRQALRKSAKRVQTYVVANINGGKLTVRTGELLRAYSSAKIRGRTRRGVIRVGIEAPSRDELGISETDPNYWPNAVEYGHGDVPAYPYLRPAVDENASTEIAAIGRDIGKGIESEAGR